MLTVAPLAELYIAKVSDGQSIEYDHLPRIARVRPLSRLLSFTSYHAERVLTLVREKAIEWAHSKGAHLICLSLGLRSRMRHPGIDLAIESARLSSTFLRRRVKYGR